jgi:hypothetical protein
MMIALLKFLLCDGWRVGCRLVCVIFITELDPIARLLTSAPVSDIAFWVVFAAQEPTKLLRNAHPAQRRRAIAQSDHVYYFRFIWRRVLTATSAMSSLSQLWSHTTLPSGLRGSDSARGAAPHMGQPRCGPWPWLAAIALLLWRRAHLPPRAPAAAPASPASPAERASSEAAAEDDDPDDPFGPFFDLPLLAPLAPPPKLALLFLVRGPIPTEPIWRAFFDDAGAAFSREHTSVRRRLLYQCQRRQAE